MLRLYCVMDRASRRGEDLLLLAAGRALAPVRVREGRKVPAMRYVEDHWTSTLITVICLASRTEYRTVQ